MSPDADLDPGALIAAYLAAHKAANPGWQPPEVFYDEDGWVHVRPSGSNPFGVTLARLREMTKRLRRRVRA